MPKRFISFLSTLIILFSLFSSAQAATTWINNVETAKKNAATEKKDMLLFFSGSDWCHWCQKLDKEVFTQDKFAQEAGKDFILVSLDFPRKKELEKSIKEQNQQMQKAYGIRGFPTVILTDADGKPYARTGYQQGGVDAYLAQLHNFHNNNAKKDALLTKADQATGLERAKLLDQALAMMMTNHLLGDRNKLIDEIIKLDPDNKAGLRAKYELQHKVAPIEKALQKTGNFDQALTDLDKLLQEETNLQPEDRQRLYLFKASICLKGKKDREAGISSLEQAAKTAPNTKIAKQIPDIIANIRGTKK
ncbi:MAG: thioredoxin family protein [Pseudomonadota bacterium]|nr:thioredoxin family protein [Pseudomonadota bacterium]